MSQVVNIDISPGGVVVIDVEGGQGSSCATATHDIELVLGGGAVKKDAKPEFFSPNATNSQSNQRTF